MLIVGLLSNIKGDKLIHPKKFQQKDWGLANLLVKIRVGRMQYTCTVLESHHAGPAWFYFKIGVLFKLIGLLLSVKPIMFLISTDGWLVK